MADPKINISDLIEKQIRQTGAEVNDSRLLMAPDMGGDFESNGRAIRNGGLLGEYGDYSRYDGGKNHYGYLGYQPEQINRLRLGVALGAYGKDLQSMNALAGLLATYPIKNGFARLLVSPGRDNPAVFLGLEKRF